MAFSSIMWSVAHCLVFLVNLVFFCINCIPDNGFHTYLGLDAQTNVTNYQEIRQKFHHTALFHSALLLLVQVSAYLLVGLPNLVRPEKSDTLWNFPCVCLLYGLLFLGILEKDCLFKMSVPITCHLFYDTYAVWNILYLISLAFLDPSDDAGQRASAAKEQEANLEIRLTDLDGRILGDGDGHERDNVV